MFHCEICRDQRYSHIWVHVMCVIVGLCKFAVRKVETVRKFACLMHINHLNAELNLISHLLALLGAHHILHVSRIRVKSICHLLALLGAHHILHVSRIRVKSICHLLALLGAHHILHVSRIKVKSHLPSDGIIRASPFSPR